ncbi:hypothetical protein COO91_03170 [Nostoc flagelliforme CCNUN1]|uniref:Uncharacterized protein n=1 Tax=Nostoc flagelliforme CCNUN1 TaxID=2038116 RepID=A0A2K8SP53_9NOSO|nr:hypothetical protein COO91_03170 [Nostoc flagelliforme CCNUN1]
MNTSSFVPTQEAVSSSPAEQSLKRRRLYLLTGTPIAQSTGA